ncbi:MAG: tryptophan--tRNA ligase [Sulfobacillus thermosulfidooxidans]|uniref:Tryptophan--tRNA ligase n=1 Tax=Sulfobacillus thermotolerans TaxID=338644 RepID=A0ABN5H2B7_9FIRM|nr:tryptophan--tRNA ligase [Sulfobacillus sp. hq2]AUW93633.1 tryptophan--tRNA ligase [Sulfobacillus thermotolerans]POB10876.1 tryptophan--tRNA ligase [Sulfobacillus sp. hq2]PSR36459.1 MAG: tryptophan--tRNA ligase [Sulfobacillus thermosulfidooxidans]
MTTTRDTVLSGMQPSGALHIGNWLGALENWVAMQDVYESYFMVADYHSLTTGYHDTSALPGLVFQMVVDWLAAGLDPHRSIIFRQSDVPQHAELHLLLSMITPLGWLERVPSYKEKLKELAQRDIHTYGFLGYPVLMSSDILLYRARKVPVGQDQVPHVELTREIVRRFNGLYGEVLPEPEAILTEAKVLPGLDGKKMSKSYGNTLALGESANDVSQKIRVMMTDPARIRKSDPGHPDVCPVFSLHKVFTAPERVSEIDVACRSAQIGCVDCKAILAGEINARLDPIREERVRWEHQPEQVQEILHQGAIKAREAAQETLSLVKDAMHLTTLE